MSRKKDDEFDPFFIGEIIETPARNKGRIPDEIPQRARVFFDERMVWKGVDTLGCFTLGPPPAHFSTAADTAHPSPVNRLNPQTEAERNFCHQNRLHIG